MGNSRHCQCKVTLVMAISVVLLLAPIFPQMCFAQNLNDTEAFLNNVEKDVTRIAAQATANFVSTCDLVASCEGSCSRQACEPLEGDSDQQTCKAVSLNANCTGPSGSPGCTQLPVSLVRSYVRLPSLSNVTLMNADNFTICSQRMLDPTFRNISGGRNKINLTAWTYFGSVEGVERSFPGRDAQEGISCTFDPRTRPWYMGATAVKKDLIVLLDAGNSMGGTVPDDIFTPEQEFESARNIIEKLLGTLTYGDRISVIKFTSSPTAILVGQALQTSTTNASAFLPLLNELNALSVDATQEHSNLTSAFFLANETFAANSNALRIVLVITDGEYADSNLLTTSQPALDSIVLQQALVLLYSFDRSDSARAALRQVACYVNGTYERIQITILNPLWTLRSYFGIVAYWRLKATNFTPYWSKVYQDYGSLGSVITAAYPAFAPDNHTLIGVAGFDVSITELGQTADDFSFALQSRISADPKGISVVPVAVPCNTQLSTLNQCLGVADDPASPLCLSNDTSHITFEERVCNCAPQCQEPAISINKSQSVSPAIIGAVGGGGALFLIFTAIITLCCCRRYSKSKKAQVENQTSALVGSGKSPKSWTSEKPPTTVASEVDGNPSYMTGTTSEGSRKTPRGSKSLKAAAWPVGNQTLKRDLIGFSHQQLEEATDGWADDAILGQGACGNVYMGELDSITMAIKRPHPGVEVAKGTFDRELDLLSKLNHRCLVRLLGYCEDDRILVFEFMANGTLEDCLHKNLLGRHLNWEERLKIAVGASKGLEYLHEYATSRIIHGDVKPANILLDDRLDAHISDFGLSMWTTNQETSCLWATRMGGTPGYFDPEFASIGAFTPGSDVYSFGIVLLEIISGRKVVQDSKNITSWASQLYEEDASAILDANLAPPPATLQSSFAGIVKLALQCVQTESRYRPRMKDVAAFLDSVLSDWHKHKADIADASPSHDNGVKHPSRRRHPRQRPTSSSLSLQSSDADDAGDGHDSDFRYTPTRSSGGPSLIDEPHLS